MKKIKSLVKRLIGRADSNALPITIDICAETVSGFVIIGWYFTEKVKELTIVDEQGNTVDSSKTDVTREDVIEKVGQPAQGFQLSWVTDKPLSSMKLAIELVSGESKKVGLNLSGGNGMTLPTMVAGSSGDVSASALAANASCEFAIVSSSHIYISGWLLDSETSIDAYLCNKKGEPVASVTHQLRHARLDVQEALSGKAKLSTGFMMLLERQEDKQINSSLCMSIDMKGRKRLQIPVNEVFYTDADAMLNLRRLLNTWAPHRPQHLAAGEMFEPIIRSLYPPEHNANVRREDYLDPVRNPRVSIVIPLYGRYDFLKYQMSHFNRYNGYRDVEIIYVVDDPSISKVTKDLAKRVSQFVERPFSVLYLSENVGFGAANNIGVEYARADTLVLMNSDVLPKGPDWLENMLSVSSDENVGIVGARLLYEDGTIQHDGMAPYTVPEYPGLYFNDHPMKGWPKSLTTHTKVVEECPLLTAAVWMLKKSLYESVGGFDPVYVLGDFEDSDFCFKVLELGKTNYIHHGAELYHLERQSQNLVESGGWKHNVTILNALTFNKRWGNQISELAKSGADEIE